MSSLLWWFFLLYETFHSVVVLKKRVVLKKKRVVFSQADSDSEINHTNTPIVSRVKQTSYARKQRQNKCKIAPPKDVFKKIPKVTKTPKKEKPVKSKTPPAPPGFKRKRPTHNYMEENAKAALDEYWET